MALRFVTVMSGAALVGASLVAAGSGSAKAQSVQTWTVTEGVCADWQGNWGMQHVGPGHWIGTSVIRVVGQKCTPRPIGTQIAANVDFKTYGNRTWTASTTNTQNAQDCQYSGTVDSGNLATGTYRCGGPTGASSNIRITSEVPFYR